jgi:hypothetical protein
VDDFALLGVAFLYPMREIYLDEAKQLGEKSFRLQRKRFKSRPFSFLNTTVQQKLCPSKYLLTYNNTAWQSTVPSWLICNWLKYLQKDTISVVLLCTGMPERNQMILTLVTQVCGKYLSPQKSVPSFIISSASFRFE